MADPATIAAIIGAIATAASTAATTIQSEVAKQGSGIASTLVNESDFDWTVTSYELNHGDWMDHPSNALSSVKSIYKMLASEAEQSLNKGPLTPQEVSQYWQLKYVAPGTTGAFVRSATTTYEMRGAGMGSEGLVKLTPKDPSCDVYVFLLVRKIPGGVYGAGVSILPRSQVDSWSIDTYGTSIIKRIMDALPNQPVAHEGEQFSTGATKTAKNGSVKVTFAAAESVEFVIANNA